MKEKWLVKLGACAILIYLIWLILNCPCGNVLCCHLSSFWVALFGLIGIVVYENGWKTFTCKC